MLLEPVRRTIKGLRAAGRRMSRRLLWYSVIRLRVIPTPRGQHEDQS
jgi:hypothetical protein